MVFVTITGEEGQSEGYLGYMDVAYLLSAGSHALLTIPPYVSRTGRSASSTVIPLVCYLRGKIPREPVRGHIMPRH
jgi:hypothetical protein